MPQHVERALRVEFAHQRGDDPLLQIAAMQRSHLRPEFRLSRPQERHHPVRKERQIDIPFGPVALNPAHPGEHRHNCRLELGLTRPTRHQVATSDPTLEASVAAASAELAVMGGQPGSSAVMALECWLAPSVWRYAVSN
ncbi:MAG: hypothetical protein OXM54_02740 [Acidimicrobiaceae bacterium]|nr:hypothetical protein [Acidimicrobiaceae bacterium]